MDTYTVPTELQYTASHLWVRREGDTAMVGLTPYGQERFGKIFYVGLPALGAPVAFGLPFGYLQSAGYGLTQLFPPVQGEVVAINEALWMTPHLVNKAPLDDGWLVAVRLSNPAELAELEDAASYEALILGKAEPRGDTLPEALTASTQPAFLIDERRRILTCNEAAEKLIGLAAKDLQHGPLCAELFGCHLDDAVATPITKSGCPGLCSMLNNEPVCDAEYVVTNASGDETTVRATYTPIARPGRPRCAVVVLNPQG
ncbi:MAG: PAS domain-containing protein [Fimbriimonadaceae bacterium]|nr:PAS domain-containing protein [Fimbriimonadaceae bacterium]